MLLGCKSSDKNTGVVDIPLEKPKSEVEKTSTSTSNEVIEQIIPYVDPKTIKELLSTVYIVDTLYGKVISNGLGNDDDTYELIFNDIIAIDLKKNREGTKKIFTIKPHKNFKSNYKFEESYYITHCIESECDQVVISKWILTDNSYTYAGHYKNIFGQKYGRTKINDIIKINNELYFLVETIQPDEGHELFRTIYVMKEVLDYRFKILDSRKIIEPYGEFEGCCKFELNSNVLYVNSLIEGLQINYKVDEKK